MPALLVDGRPVISGFYRPRELAAGLGLGPDAWGVPRRRAEAERRALLPVLDGLAAASAEAARHVPDSQLDERPEEPMWSFRELAHHSFAFNQKVMLACRGIRPMTWEAVNAYVEESLAFGSGAEIADSGLRLHREFREWLAAQGPELWTSELETFSGPQPAEEMLFFARAHMAFHLRQLYRYLDAIGAGAFERLPDVELESLDEPMPMAGGTLVTGDGH